MYSEIAPRRQGGSTPAVSRTPGDPRCRNGRSLAATGLARAVFLLDDLHPLLLRLGESGPVDRGGGIGAAAGRADIEEYRDHANNEPEPRRTAFSRDQWGHLLGVRRLGA